MEFAQCPSDCVGLFQVQILNVPHLENCKVDKVVRIQIQCMSDSSDWGRKLKRSKNRTVIGQFYVLNISVLQSTKTL